LGIPFGTRRGQKKKKSVNSKKKNGRKEKGGPSNHQIGWVYEKKSPEGNMGPEHERKKEFNHRTWGWGGRGEKSVELREHSEKGKKKRKLKKVKYEAAGRNRKKSREQKKKEKKGAERTQGGTKPETLKRTRAQTWKGLGNKRESIQRANRNSRPLAYGTKGRRKKGGSMKIGMEKKRRGKKPWEMWTSQKSTPGGMLDVGKN